MAPTTPATDAHEAMTSDRPYRTGLLGPEALRRLREAAGTQFDPDVIRVFVRLMEQPQPGPAPAETIVQRGLPVVPSTD